MKVEHFTKDSILFKVPTLNNEIIFSDVIQLKDFFISIKNNFKLEWIKKDILKKGFDNNPTLTSHDSGVFMNNILKNCKITINEIKRLR